MSPRRPPERNRTFKSRKEFNALAREFERNMKAVLSYLMRVGLMKESEYDTVRKDVLSRAIRKYRKVPSGRGQNGWIKCVALRAVSTLRRRKQLDVVPFGGKDHVHNVVDRIPARENRFGTCFQSDFDEVKKRLRNMRREYLQIIELKTEQGQTLAQIAHKLKKSRRQISNYWCEIRAVIKREFPELREYLR